MSELITEEARAWIGLSAPPQRVEVNRSDIIKYSVATEQRAEKYLRGDEAPPMFLAGILRPLVPLDQLGPDGIAEDSFKPDLPLKRVMAGGHDSIFHRPVKPGEILFAIRSLTDMYEKQGASGPLIFLVYNIKVVTEKGETVMEEKQTRIFR